MTDERDEQAAVSPELEPVTPLADNTTDSVGEIQLETNEPAKAKRRAKVKKEPDPPVPASDPPPVTKKTHGVPPWTEQWRATARISDSRFRAMRNVFPMSKLLKDETALAELVAQAFGWLDDGIPNVEAGLQYLRGLLNPTKAEFDAWWATVPHGPRSSIDANGWTRFIDQFPKIA